MGQERTRKAAKAEVPQILLKADAVTITLSGEKDGKIRARASAWQEPVVVLDGEMLEVRNQAGQVVILRRKAK